MDGTILKRHIDVLHASFLAARKLECVLGRPKRPSAKLG